MDSPSRQDYGDGAGRLGPGTAGRPAGWAPVGSSAGQGASRPPGTGAGPSAAPGSRGLARTEPRRDPVDPRREPDLAGLPRATGHAGPGPEVVRTILGETLPATAPAAWEAPAGPVAPVVLATTSEGAPVVPAPEAGEPWADHGLDGHVALDPIEPALAETVRRAQASGTPFSLVLARPGVGATPGVPVPAASPAEVADLAAAFSCALEPAHALVSRLDRPTWLSSSRATAGATPSPWRSATADGGAPTFTWVAVRYPKDAANRRVGCCSSRPTGSTASATGWSSRRPAHGGAAAAHLPPSARRRPS